jgi:hypothetical protein
VALGINCSYRFVEIKVLMKVNCLARAVYFHVSLVVNILRFLISLLLEMNSLDKNFIQITYKNLFLAQRHNKIFSQQK